MLTGMYPPTAGTATVFGLDITQQMDQVRQNLGVCPQHSVVWDELTIEEHLHLFGGLKGLSGETLQQRVQTAIAEVALEEKRYSKSSECSGGQQRRLSLAMALIGDSRVIFLDESVLLILHSCYSGDETSLGCVVSECCDLTRAA